MIKRTILLSALLLVVSVISFSPPAQAYYVCRERINPYYQDCADQCYRAETVCYRLAPTVWPTCPSQYNTCTDDCEETYGGPTILFCYEVN